MSKASRHSLLTPKKKKKKSATFFTPFDHFRITFTRRGVQHFFFPVLLAAIGWDKQGIDEMAVDKSFSISVYPQLRRGNLSIRHTGLM